MCPVCYQTGGKLLPCLSTLTGHQTGGLFLLHWLEGHPYRTLSGILPCEARTFLTISLSSEMARPFVCLSTGDIISQNIFRNNNISLIFPINSQKDSFMSQNSFLQ